MEDYPGRINGLIKQSLEYTIYFFCSCEGLRPAAEGATPLYRKDSAIFYQYMRNFAEGYKMAKFKLELQLENKS